MPADNPSLLEQLEAIGLDRLIPSFQAASRESIRLHTTNPSDDAVSRIGGAPNLPEEIPWPIGKNGQPLSFLAQLDLAELPSISSIDLPKKGSLYFFYNSTEQPWGFNPADAGEFKVIFSPSALPSNPLRMVDNELEEEIRFSGVTLTATREEWFPGLEGGQMDEFEVSDDEFDAYLGILESSGTMHRIGGHADLIQNPIEIEAQLVSNGIYCGDPDAYDSAEAIRLAPGAADWLLLLQLGSEEASGMMWGDMGRLYFLIHKEDLANGNFDKVWTILQCS
jgi:uncharacterized protein YwqG